MADTAAFLAGCAVTGVAALFLLRNDLAISQPRVLQSSPIEPVVMPSPSGIFQDPGQGWKLQTQVEQQQGIARDLTDQFRKQQSDTQDIKSQLEKQQTQSEDLRVQLERQQRHTEQLLTQLQEQQRLIDTMAAQKQSDPTALLRNDPSSGQVQSTILWIGGGILLVVLVSGGLVLIGVIVLVMMSSRRRQTRTVHVVHPVPTPYNFAEQPQLLPPARTRIKPPRQVDYYDE
ncbi:MAG TPA: hypothetical protein V6C84_28535 [Coleofasciculaceae cyanobacterium]|jgi:hypothetical protein